MTKVVLKEWRRRLQRAVRRGYFSMSDMKKAGSWACCAVGERDLLCKGLLKINESWTSDNDVFIRQSFGSQIYQLGVDFATAINDNQFVKVQDIIEQVERFEVQEFYK